MKITAERIRELLSETLLGTAEGPSALRIECIANTFVFDAPKLEKFREEIRGMAQEFPDAFFEGSGDGWSFLNLCYDRHGVQWGEHPDMEAFCALAIGAKVGKWVMPRDFWSALPGGMPYIKFKREGLYE